MKLCSILSCRGLLKSFIFRGMRNKEASENSETSLVIRSGLEPETYCLEGSCSIQLSYQTDLFAFAGAKIDIFSETHKF